MHKIDKFLIKLPLRERLAVEEHLKLIKSGDFSNLNLKKLKGKENTFRVRVGSVRIIFTLINHQIEITSVDWRNKNTYNF